MQNPLLRVLDDFRHRATVWTVPQLQLSLTDHPRNVVKSMGVATMGQGRLNVRPICLDDVHHVAIATRFHVSVAVQT